MHPAVKQLVTTLVPRPLLRPLLQRRFLATREWANRHWGVFDSFEAANQWIAAQGQVSQFRLDHRRWREERLGLMVHDYPMLFWLDRVLQGRSTARVADLGGSVGVSYYAFRRVLPFGDGLQWQVCELPETVAAGREIAQEQGAVQLSFTSDPAALDGADVLFAAGAIQYIETPLPDTLRAMQAPPAHVLINRLPLSGRHPTHVTLQHSGQAISPYRIANRREFLDAMAQAGYRQVDTWRCLENATDIPLHPEHALPWFHGFYFTRQDTAR